VLLVAVLLVLLGLVGGCGSSGSSSPAPAATRPTSWLGMDPGDARAFTGPAGRLVLIVADETYDIDGAYASALIWKHGSHYTTDYWLQADDGTLWWYGRKGSWRAGRHGEQPRSVPLGTTATFGDRTLTLGTDGPTQVETPDGVFTG
jgi:hypothetical protein